MRRIAGGTSLYREGFIHRLLELGRPVCGAGRGRCTPASIALALLLICLLVPSTTHAKTPGASFDPRHQQRHVRWQTHKYIRGNVSAHSARLAISHQTTVCGGRRRRPKSLARGSLPIQGTHLNASLIRLVDGSVGGEPCPSHFTKLRLLDRCRGNPPPLSDRDAALPLTPRRAAAT